MIRDDVLSVVAERALASGAAVFAGNGLNARALCHLGDRPEFFYMVGSMGLCAPLAAGFSRRAARPVIAVEGDGNALMGLSALPVVARAASRPFLHVVLNNGRYEGTGGQVSLADQVDFRALARAAGYDDACRVREPAALREAAAEGLRAGRLVLIECVVARQDRIAYPRVPLQPQEIAERFSRAAGHRMGA